jgi:NAD(P)-dependent dehydrogenase (short-subunit alcohol dehydrogenase family)
MAGRVARKTIVVTGGAGGLGRAISLLVAKEGAAVGVLDIDGARAREVAKRLTDEGSNAVGVDADVADSNAISQAMRHVEEMLGPIHGLVNNAGVAALGSVHETDEHSWRRVMDINVNGVFLACKAVLPGMLERGHGTIVNIASIAGLVGIHDMAAYCASKGAVISLTRQLAVDYASFGIRANVIAPGTISSTDMGKRLLQSDATPEAQARRLAKYPIGRYATPDEIAQAALFLLSEEASFATGSIFTIDGGMTAL